MSQINLQGLINNISEKTSVYTPIIEAIVNSLESIETSNNPDGVIRITVKRESQVPIGFDDDSLPRISSIEIYDNVIGFNDSNTLSFDTLYSAQKNESGGKGFGRFMFLKYFDKVYVDSTYKKGVKLFRREFSFSSKNQPVESLIGNEKVSEYNSEDLRTKVILDSLKEQYLDRLEKKLETIARNLVEKLLPCFINDKYKCPKIILEEPGDTNQIVLNEFFDEYEGIKKISEEKFSLTKGDLTEEFEVKIFKIYYTKNTSSVILTAHSIF